MFEIINKEQINSQQTKLFLISNEHETKYVFCLNVQNFGYLGKNFLL
ncbi:MAG: hypothetical protein CH6_1291 [Candidatus Kapaibacterium sp.]|nr:MAG: hypothetical protein CH6_1291 [Candidatus Kapabacteria bacterium]